MGNCLVTKLKGVVDNDNLLKLGEVRLVFNQLTNSEPSIGIYSSPEQMDIHVSPNANLWDAGPRATPVGDLHQVVSEVLGLTGARGFLWSDNGEVSIKFNKKYDSVRAFYLNDVEISSFNDALDCVVYSTVLESVRFSYISGCGDITAQEVVGAFLSPGTIKNFSIEGSTCVKGSTTDFTALYDAEEIDLSKATGISGKFEDLLVGMLTNRTNANRCKCGGWTNPNVTFHDAAIAASIYAEFSNGSITVYDNDNTTVIGTYNGSAWSYQ